MLRWTGCARLGTPGKGPGPSGPNEGEPQASQPAGEAPPGQDFLEPVAAQPLKGLLLVSLGGGRPGVPPALGRVGSDARSAGEQGPKGHRRIIRFTGDVTIRRAARVAPDLARTGVIPPIAPHILTSATAEEAEERAEAHPAAAPAFSCLVP